MPVVIVELWQGQTVEQKRELVRAITDAMISRENWANGGVLGIDREDT